jgi:DNA-binding NtrC family response regulator
MTADSNVLRFPPPRTTTAAYTGDEALLGAGPAIARVWSQIRRVAPHFRAAVITGEPGSGAEAAARSLHALSPVSQLPFAVLEAADAESLLSANSIHSVLEGLIFIPDVNRLSAPAQRGLIRKLRIRGRAPLRVVGSTTAELRASVSAGRFSPELAEILGTVRIVLPPLRERTEDIPLLVTQLARSVAERLGIASPTFAPSFHEAAIAFAWPGNFAQLEMILTHLLSTTAGLTLTAEHFAAATAHVPEATSLIPTPPRMVRLEEVVQEHIRAVLIGCQGNKLRAAEILGISRSTLYRMLDGAVANPHLSLAG